jgi:hypothetical protein
LATPQDDSQKKSFWDIAGPRIGVVSGTIGIFVASIGLPQKVADALGKSESKQSRLELEQQRVAVAAAGPRLEVSYLFSALEFPSFQPAGRKSGSGKGEAETLSSLPFIENEIGREDGSARPHCGLGDAVELSLGFLLIRNRGQRDADQIAVRVERLELAKPVRVREPESGHRDDYVAKLRSGAAATSTIDIAIPTTLGAGDAIRVPLFWSVARYGRHDQWCVNSSTAYLPRSVVFADPVVGTKKRQAVRRMADPVVLAYGVYGRG